MLSQLNFLVLDTETTGLDAQVDRVVDVAAVMVRNGQIVGSFTSLVNPGVPIPPRASAIHGITNDQVQDAPTLAQLYPRLKALVEEADCLVAHNAPFDASFLPELTARPWLDTYRLVQYLYPDLSCYQNAALKYQFNLACPEAAGMPLHRALPDAYITSRVLLHLLKSAKEKSLGDLLSAIAAPILLQTCTFGKYRGQKWEDVPKDYLTWVVKQQMSADILYTANYYL